MAPTTLDPMTALVVVDLQEGVVPVPTARPTAGAIENAAARCAAFRRHRLPGVLVRVGGAAAGRTEQASRAGDRRHA